MGKSTRIVMPRWMAPPCDVIKINLDASIDKARKLMGVGIIARDSMRQVWNRYGNLIEDSKTLLNSISSWRAHHVQREANSVAHFLAKEALLQVSEKFWIEEYLAILHDIVKSENLFWCF